MTSSPEPAPEPRRHLGLDLGGTNIKVAVVEERDGAALTVVLRERSPTEAHRGPEGVVRRLAEVGREALERHGAVGTVGVGVPGVFREDTGRAVLLPNLPGVWDGVPVRDPLAAALGRPVAMVNDARAFSLAEPLLRGTGGVGEIGHQTVLLGGPRCGCGNSGCAEALTRADVFARLGGRATAEEVYGAARAGDATALAAVEHVVQWLGVALANAYVLLAPDAFVVGGGIAAAGDLLLGPLEAAVRRHVFIVPPERIRVLPAALGSYAGAIGAALFGREAEGETLETASMA